MIEGLFTCSYEHIKVVTETQQTASRVSWGLDEQALQLGREIKNHPAKGCSRMGQGRKASWSQAAEWDGGCGSCSCKRFLKGPCPKPDFRSEGLTRSEHQCPVSCLRGTGDLEGYTELLE